MDSRLDGLNLPVVKPDIPGPGVADLEGPNYPPYHVALLIHHYFEWVGTFESGAFAVITHSRNNSRAHVTEDTSPPTGLSTYMLRLQELAGEEAVIKWRRVTGQARVFNGQPGSVFVFESL